MRPVTETRTMVDIPLRSGWARGQARFGSVRLGSLSFKSARQAQGKRPRITRRRAGGERNSLAPRRIFHSRRRSRQLKCQPTACGNQQRALSLSRAAPPPPTGRRNAKLAHPHWHSWTVMTGADATFASKTEARELPRGYHKSQSEPVMVRQRCQIENYDKCNRTTALAASLLSWLTSQLVQ